ncbi:non-histone chromosomal protein 6 [Stylonychia lemnae]|uniref:Non-histone chromosomal protein 6 n=1 Tax=Stylonychia lemnae TaxID=5949 RepID=A0A077ZX11_STYLE|nr:non-histone chromosomal protein 6 [Stylonychia lemnae]|eukprot:CDW74415.1 non-histone chromosomal protein 6 [Stylonychia lemnae]
MINPVNNYPLLQDEEEKDDYGEGNRLILSDFQLGDIKSRSQSGSLSHYSESSQESHYSKASNWTKGRSRQRLKVPVSLKNNNQISKAVKDRKSITKPNPKQKFTDPQKDIVQQVVEEQIKNEVEPEFNDKPIPPKRPLSPYIFFSQERRKILKQIHPGWSTKQIMRVVSQQWNRLADDQKAQYKVMSDSDRKRFDDEKKQQRQSTRGKRKKGQIPQPDQLKPIEEKPEILILTP